MSVACHCSDVTTATAAAAAAASEKVHAAAQALSLQHRHILVTTVIGLPLVHSDVLEVGIWRRSNSIEYVTRKQS